MQKIRFLIVLVAAGVVLGGCSGPETKPIAGNSASPAANQPAAAPTVAVVGSTPAGTADGTAKLPKKAVLKNVTGSDIAKIKWLSGSFRGTGGQPFFNTYAWNGTTLNIASYDDDAMTRLREKSSFELKDGMFANPEGKDRFAATEITEDRVEFVTVTDKYAILRFERQGDGTFKASIDWAGDDGNPHNVSYIMEPLKK